MIFPTVQQRAARLIRDEFKASGYDPLGCAAALAAAGLLADPTSSLTDELLAALKEAREDLASWAAYAPEYFQEKWDLAGDLARIDGQIAAAADRLVASKGGDMTPEQAAVIDAAKALVDDHARFPAGCPDWDEETAALIAAVERLATSKEAT